MSLKLKYLFLALFLLSISCLTVQGTVISFLQDGNYVKKQFNSNTIRTSEEEEEQHGKEKTQTEEDLFSDNHHFPGMIVVFRNIVWPEHTEDYLSTVIHKYTPPPKF